ncbi:MAG: tryptophan synthase subunit alpha, partial [Robiginitalea sp.]
MNRAKTKTVNRIGAALEKDGPLLSIYFTAGYPDLEDTLPVLRHLQASGVDMVEIGLPFSDPLADGPTIQQSSTAALKNGMHTPLLLEQLK